MQEFDDPVFVNAYSYDMCKIVAVLDAKIKSKGMVDNEFKNKLK